MAVITAVIMWVFLENVMPVLPMPSLDVLPTGNFSLYNSLLKRKSFPTAHIKTVLNSLIFLYLQTEIIPIM